MDFEGNNMFCLNSQIIGEHENSNNSGNTHCNGFAWYSWEPTTSSTTTAAESSAATRHYHRQQEEQPPLYDGHGPHVHLDPYLTCLKLGKRHYFEDSNNNNNVATLGERHVDGGGEFIASSARNNNKRARSHYLSGGGAAAGGVKTASFTTATVPRCQVEGCHVALLDAKEYHKRHKVCEMHSKAPKVVVLGMEQRFCQQCSRFHVVSEFDDSKRSCRRRLAGHNERRRKSSHDSVARNSIQGCARSLLSSRSDYCLSHADLSTRCSAALRELIEENRAALMTRQHVFDRDCNLHHHVVEDFKEIQPDSNYFPQQMFPQTQ